MTDNNEMLSCLNCGSSETAVPLVAIRFNGQGNWICSQCMPILIHNAHRLAEKLQGVENLPDLPVTGN